MHMSKIRNKRENEATIEKPSEGAFILKHPGRRKAYSETRETEIRTKEPRGSSLEEPSYDANIANCTEIPPPERWPEKMSLEGGHSGKTDSIACARLPQFE